MNAAQAIAALDRAVAAAGEDIVLRRQTKGPGSSFATFEVTCRASVRPYPPAELVGDVKQGDVKVILSPTEMEDRQWPWPPVIGDKVVVGGRTMGVMDVGLIRLGADMVRIELRARG